MSENKMWEAAAKLREIIGLNEKQNELLRQAADSYSLRAAYDLPLEGGYGFRIIDESAPIHARVDSNGQGRGKYGRYIKGVVHIYKGNEVIQKDDLLEFYRKTRGVFLRG